jgi:hypothetical protein
MFLNTNQQRTEFLSMLLTSTFHLAKPLIVMGTPSDKCMNTMQLTELLEGVGKKILSDIGKHGTIQMDKDLVGMVDGINECLKLNNVEECACKRNKKVCSSCQNEE